MAVAAAFIGTAVLRSQAGPDWRSLFNGRDLSGWETYLGRPEPSVMVPGQPLVSGRVQLQSEGAELFVRRIEIPEVSDRADARPETLGFSF